LAKRQKYSDVVETTTFYFSGDFAHNTFPRKSYLHLHLSHLPKRNHLEPNVWTLLWILDYSCNTSIYHGSNPQISRNNPQFPSDHYRLLVAGVNMSSEKKLKCKTHWASLGAFRLAEEGDLISLRGQSVTYDVSGTLMLMKQRSTAAIHRHPSGAGRAPSWPPCGEALDPSWRSAAVTHNGAAMNAKGQH